VLFSAIRYHVKRGQITKAYNYAIYIGEVLDEEIEELKSIRMRDIIDESVNTTASGTWPPSMLVMNTGTSSEYISFNGGNDEK
jgi:hypothetical protein